PHVPGRESLARERGSGPGARDGVPCPGPSPALVQPARVLRARADALVRLARAGGSAVDRRPADCAPRAAAGERTALERGPRQARGALVLDLHAAPACALVEPRRGAAPL